MSLAALADELGKCAALWPSLNPSNPAVITAYREVLGGFTEEEIRAGFRRVRQTHEGTSFPKPATIAALCGAARGHHNVGASDRRDANGCDVKCDRCGTVVLYHEATDDGRLGRLFPWHLPGCALTRRDQPQREDSARLVWPQPRNGGRYVAPARVSALLAGHVDRMTA